MKISYVDHAFGPANLALIDRSNAIIADYRRQGFVLTLRQLYYQMVSRDVIPNTQRSYKRLGDILNDARLAGLVDWDAIEDRTRNLKVNPHWESPAEIMRAVGQSYAVDKWADQPNRVEVWVEKDALGGIVGGIASRLDVPWFSCRGYTSQSELWAAAMRAKRRLVKGQTPVILHLGDHDPSGIDMTRDIFDRFALFVGEEVAVERLALNMDQVEQYGPPPNPAKTSDSRYAGYMDVHGDESWELDALEPRVISELIEEAVLVRRDEDLWDAAVAAEKTSRAGLDRAAQLWPRVEAFLAGDASKPDPTVVEKLREVRGLAEAINDVTSERTCSGYADEIRGLIRDVLFDLGAEPFDDDDTEEVEE